MNGDRAETLHAGVLSVIEGLVKDDPEPDTQAGKALIALATAVEEYEKSVASERPPITDNDKRWRFLEHGCQWVSWIPAGGDQVSFDPRQVTGFAGDLNDMRGQADIEIRKQLAILRDGVHELEHKHGK